jgi:hypothetical protein
MKNIPLGMLFDKKPPILFSELADDINTYQLSLPLKMRTKYSDIKAPLRIAVRVSSKSILSGLPYFLSPEKIGLYIGNLFTKKSGMPMLLCAYGCQLFIHKMVPDEIECYNLLS